MASIDERIAALEEKAKKLREQKKAKDELVAQRKLHALIKGKRSDDTRRKILIGALILTDLDRENGQWIADKAAFMEYLDRDGLKRPEDRALFGLPPKPAKNPAKEPTL
ncbi:mobilization protein [Paraburkholderia xenovorans]|jgi:hypothetical protein